MVSRKGKPLQSLPPRPRLPCPRAGSGPLVAAGPGAAWESRGVMEPAIDRQKQLIVWVKKW